MSRLGQIYKQEKVEGGGVISTLSKRGKEKFDPRQFFDQDGLLANMLPGLFKSYKAIPKRKPYEVKYQRLNDINSNINVLKAITLSIAKNTSILPAIQRDTNIMRQNLVNLVKKMGGKTVSTTDEFFKNAQEREKFYEKQFEDKDKNSPEKVSDPNKKDGIDWMKWGIIGGVVVAGIAKYFSDPEFKEKVNGMINSFGKTVFGEENWKGITESISKGFGEIFKPIEDMFINHWGKILTGALLLLKPFSSLRMALGALLGTVEFVGKGLFKILKSIMSGGSVPPVGDADIPDKPDNKTNKTKPTGRKTKGIKPKIGGKVLGVGGLAVGAAAGVLLDPKDMGDGTFEGRYNTAVNNVENKKEEIKRFEEKTLPNIIKYPDGTSTKDEWDKKIKGGKVQLEKLKAELKALEKEEIEAKKLYDNSNSISPTKVDDNEFPSWESMMKRNESKDSSSGEALITKLLDEKGIEDKELRNIIFGLAETESSMNPNARGPVIPPPEPGKKPSIHVGDQAHGLFQIMPKTAEEMGYSRSDIKDPEKAARAGLEYFLKNYKKFGDSGLAVLAHHAGPGKVNEYLKTGKIDTKDLATGLSTNDYYKKVMKNAGTGQSVEALPNVKSDAATNVHSQNDTPKSVENKKYPNILDIFDGIGSLVKNVPSEVSKEFPGVTKELEKGWGEMRSYAMKRLELPPVVVNNQQPQQPPSNQGVPQNLASISSVVDQDFIALLFNKSMWGSPASSV